jgi:hypothetical protein
MLGSYFPDNPELDNLLVTNADQLPAYFKDMADNVYNMGKTAREAQMREERELAREKMRNETQLEIAKLNAGSRVDAAKARSGAGAKTEEELVSKMGYEKASVYYDAKASEAEQSGNTDRAEMYRAKSDKMKMAYERAKLLQGMVQQGGKVDIGAATGMATNPQPEPQGFNKTPPPEGKVRVQRADGKVGFIPKAQLAEALKNGYKEMK